MNTYKEIKALKIGKVTKNIDMSKNTTYKAGGIASYMVYPNNSEHLIKLLRYLKDKNIKYKVVGACSNLLFSDNLYDGVLIRLDSFDNLRINKTVITVGAGYKLVSLANKLSRLGLSGLEFATGIPGTVGWAV